MTVGLGIVTVPERKDYLELVTEGITTHLSDVVDVLVTSSDDGHRGVAWSKNRSLLFLLERGCEWLFICEDDILVESDMAVIGYIDACQASGYEHLNFHAHGAANPESRAKSSPWPSVTYWPNMVGAWSIYTRHSLEIGGFLDENFVNCWDHCEHTQRLATLGFTSKWPDNADATGSENWLTEIPGSIENSSIWKLGGDRHHEYMREGRAYWFRTYPDSYARVFGRGGL